MIQGSHCLSTVCSLLKKVQKSNKTFPPQDILQNEIRDIRVPVRKRSVQDTRLKHVEYKCICISTERITTQFSSLFSCESHSRNCKPWSLSQWVTLFNIIHHPWYNNFIVYDVIMMSYWHYYRIFHTCSLLSYESWELYPEYSQMWECEMLYCHPRRTYYSFIHSNHLNTEQERRRRSVIQMCDCVM